ncbi:hypothetical protein O9929_03060 [Vibrio lentus]|nr:hypothetical protein [Vibrio lentus]
MNFVAQRWQAFRSRLSKTSCACHKHHHAAFQFEGLLAKAIGASENEDKIADAATAIFVLINAENIRSFLSAYKYVKSIYARHHIKCKEFECKYY